MDKSTAAPSFQFRKEDIYQFEQQRKALLQSIHNADRCLSLANWKEHSLCAVSAIDTKAVYDHYIEAATHMKITLPPFSDELMAYQRAKKTVMKARASILEHIDQLERILIRSKHIMCSKTDTDTLLKRKDDNRTRNTERS